MSESVLELKGEPLKYVSRGGLKLEGALRNFEVDATVWKCLMWVLPQAVQ
ncbi:MAG: hypothetical protein Ct9H90mP8_0350 [Pseudomonadota bacterium]|nr:MAG: hypothetical protein Ct9H90mP8_0350 [Pseudomonadota bacterium]